VESITCPLGQLITAVTQEGEQSKVAEDLELLANFGADVGIVGVESREVIFEGVDVSKIERRFVEGADRVEEIEGPATLFGFERGERLEFAEDAGCFRGSDWPIVLYEEDPGIGRNSA
jgi:hypothetical protein